MTISPGSRLGPYEVLASIGAGGMGEVYKARDTRLDRTVAVKVISGFAAGDPELRQRFEREARTISQLSHPHICALYDVGRHEGIDYLVMELIEGETLADRLARGPLPIEQALRTAIEVADALSSAHRRGIIHRDLKPGNVMLTKTGTKLLDFGLAKIAGPAIPAGVTGMPTTPANLTGQGAILGTFQYMSPEQLEGGEADARSDIFAFGSMLHEMITGRRAFEGKSQAGLISAILTAEPPRVTSVQPLAPAALDYAVARCLAKDPDDRWQSAKDLGAELRRVAGASLMATSMSSSNQTAAAVPQRRRRLPVAWIAAAVLAVTTVALAAWIAIASRATPAAPRHLAIPVSPAEGLDGRFTLSPDGERFAFVGQREGRTQLFLRSIGRPDATVLVPTAQISSGGPAFSPDGKWLAYTGATKLWKVSVDGGAPVPLIGQANSATGRPSWSASGSIVFENSVRGLSLIPAGGGEPKVLTQAAPAKELLHFAPWLTADGKTLLFVIRRAESDYASGMLLVAQSLESGERKVLGDGSAPVYLESGQIVFEREGTLFAAGFDPKGLRLTSEPAPVLEGVASRLGVPMFSVAQDGAIAYLSARDGGVGEGYLSLVDSRGGHSQLALPPHRYSDPRLSPDGQRIAVHVFEEGRENYIADIVRGTLIRLTFDPGEDETPIWSPDGTSVLYTSTRTNLERAIFRRNADGSGSEEQLWSGTGHLHLGGFTPDGRTLVLAIAREQQFDIATFAIGDKDLKPLLTSRFNKTSPVLSPDGRWLAYVSEETGRPEVYVQPFPSLNGRWPISNSGGHEPMWSRNGRRLFYRTTGKLMAVDVTADQSFAASAPVVQFEDRFLATQGDSHTCYDVFADGRQFLMVARAGGSTLPTHVNLILNALTGR